MRVYVRACVRACVRAYECVCTFLEALTLAHCCKKKSIPRLVKETTSIFLKPSKHTGEEVLVVSPENVISGLNIFLTTGIQWCDMDTTEQIQMEQ